MGSLRAEGNTVRYLYFRIFLQDHKGQNAPSDYEILEQYVRKGEKKHPQTPIYRTGYCNVVGWFACCHLEAVGPSQ